MPIASLFRRIRRRELLFATLRCVLASLVAGLVTFALLALFAGSHLTLFGLIIAWSIVLTISGASALYFWRQAFPSGRRHPSENLATIDPSWVSMFRTAAEFEPGALETQAEAHSAQAQSKAQPLRTAAYKHAAALLPIDLSDLVPGSRFFPGRLVLLLAGSAILSAALLTTGNARLGSFALTHASETQDTAVARFVDEARFTVESPPYLRIPSTSTSPLVEPAPPPPAYENEDFSARESGVVHLSIDSRLDLTRARAVIDTADESRVIHLERTAEARKWSGQFVAEQSASIRFIGVDTSGQELHDAARFRLNVIRDDAPEITLILPPELGDTIARDATIRIPFTVLDEYGAAGARLMVQSANGPDIRRPLTLTELSRSYNPGSSAQPFAASGLIELTVEETLARPGDSIHLWVEASDLADPPQRGESEHLRLQVESESERRESLARAIDDCVALGLDALADRLEHPDLTEGGRGELVSASSLAFHTALSALAEGDELGIDESVLSAMAMRIKRMLRRERRAQGPALAAIDREIVDRLERDVLFLDDLVTSMRRRDIAELVRELDVLRRELASLLEELMRTESEEARRAISATIARARDRLSELRSRLSQLQQDAPSEFSNAPSPEAIAEAQQSAEDTGSALDQLESALRQNDYDTAQAQLEALRAEIDGLAQSEHGEAGLAGNPGSPDPRQQATREAMDLLEGIVREQADLAGRSANTRRLAAEAAEQSAGDTLESIARRLATDAETTTDALREIPQESLGHFDQETLELAIQRAQDAQDALEAGDFAEARRMSSDAEAYASRLARELDLTALVHGDTRGRAAAQAADAAADQMGELSVSLDEAIPNLESFVEAEGRAQLAEDAPRQGETRSATDRLRELFESEPDGQPLSPEGASVAEEAMGLMERGQGHLEGERAAPAARAQGDAHELLAELLEQMQQDQNSSSGGDQQEAPRERVVLPGESERGRDRRREILDAMRSQTPEGFEEANRRYFEGLL